VSAPSFVAVPSHHHSYWSHFLPVVAKETITFKLKEKNVKAERGRMRTMNEAVNDSQQVANSKLMTKL
jgi:hypothetical protein